MYYIKMIVIHIMLMFENQLVQSDILYGDKMCIVVHNLAQLIL